MSSHASRCARFLSGRSAGDHASATVSSHCANRGTRRERPMPWLSSRNLPALCFGSFLSTKMRNKKPLPVMPRQGLCVRCLAASYFHMGRPQTIIGAERFHFRVRDGVGWFPLAMTARQTPLSGKRLLSPGSPLEQPPWRLHRGSCRASCFPFAERPLGCYMVKPHGQLVLVSYTHYCASTPSLSTSSSSTDL